MTDRIDQTSDDRISGADVIDGVLILRRLDGSTTEASLGGGSLTDLDDYTEDSFDPDGLVPVLSRTPTNEWSLSTVGQHQVMSIDSSSDGTTLYPGQIVLVDVTNGSIVVALKNLIYSVVQIKKVDASANTITVQSEGGERFSDIDGSSTKVITTQDELVTFVCDNDGVWHTL